MSETAPESNRRFALRFSLLTALLLMTILGMAIVLVRLWREVGPLRAEMRRLRDETGRLSVDDATKIHAIEVRTGESLLWKWRVWVPQGQTVGAGYRWGNIPSSGVPPASGSVYLKPGENWITLRAHVSSSGNSWSALLETDGNSVGTRIPESDRWWQWPTTSSAESGAGFTTTIAGERDPIFVWKRLRVSPIKNLSESLQPTIPAASTAPAALTAGFIIWLERK